jgi:hypothetical protein
MLQINIKYISRLSACLVLLTSSALVGQVTLAVPLIPQESDYTCWAASCRMVHEGFGKYNMTTGNSYTEKNILDYATSSVARENALYAGPWYCDGVLDKYGTLKSIGATSPLTFNDAGRNFTLKKEIDEGRPIMIKRSRGLDDHNVVIKGYKDDDKIVINDPWKPNVGEIKALPNL